VPFGEKLTPRQRVFLLFSLMVTLFLAALDQTVVSTATPKILADLQGFDLLPWLFTSYMLTSTVVIPVLGRLGDLYGRKWIMVVGVVVFVVSSVLCGASQSMEALISFRFLQGLGGGAIFACVFATVGDAFSPRDRGKYIGLFAGTFSLAAIIGPTFGGFLTDHGGWRWVFYINLPISLIALPAILVNIPARQEHRQVSIDWLGAVALAGASVAFLLAFVWAGDKYAWDSWQIISLLGASVAGTGLFILVEARAKEPIIPLQLFRNRVFVLSNLIVFMFGLGVFGAFQFLGLFVQTALGASATISGVINTPQAVATLLTSVVGGQVISRYGRYKWQTVFGAVLVCIAMGLMQTLDTDIAKWRITVNVMILGLGFGLVLPTMSVIAQGVVAPQFIGVASSANQFFRQMGAVMGIAIFGSVLSNFYNEGFADRFNAADRAAVGPAIVAQLEDPTLPLNKGVYQVVQAKVLGLPDGPALLTRSQDAQSESVAEATRLIYLGALAAALACLAFALVLDEVPLRRGAQVTVSAGKPAEGVGAEHEGARGATSVPEPSPPGPGV